MSKDDKDKANAANVEFSVEFGDVNGIKLYEFPLKNKKSTKKEKRK